MLTSVVIRAVMVSLLWWFVLSESERELPPKNSCQKFSHPYDKVEFDEYLSNFLEKDEFGSTKSTTEFCNENEVSFPDDIDVIKSLAKNLENIINDVKERMVKMDIDFNSNIVKINKDIEEIKEHVGLKKVIGNTQNKDIEEIKEDVGLKKAVGNTQNKDIEEIKEDVGLKKAIGNTQNTDIEEIKEHVGLKKAIDLASCPGGRGYYQTSFGCFWVSKKWIKHEDAKQRCLSLGMDLASLEHLQSKTELDKLSLELNLNDVFYVIGLKKDPSGGQWRWTSGAELPDNSPLWYPGQPDNDGGEEHWGFLWRGGSLYDRRNYARPFICSMPQSHKTLSV